MLKQTNYLAEKSCKKGILLINPLIRENDTPNDFPSGLGYIAAILLNAGYRVKVIDINGYRYKKEEAIRLLEESIIKEGFEIIGTGCLITCYNYLKWLIHEIKRIKPEAKIIVGGGMGTSIPDIAIEKLKADIVVVGEGEESILDIMSALQTNNPVEALKRVRGILFRDGNKIAKTPLREPIKNLDLLPYPAWDLFPIHVYLRNFWGEMKDIGAKSESSMNIVCGRGCPFNCTYCYDPLGHSRRIRSVESVISEIKVLKERYNLDFVMFSDPVFMTDKQWVINLCNKIISEKLNIKWASAGRVNLVDADLLKKMKSAGCIYINFGIESGSQKMLNIIKKGVTVKQAADAIKLTRESKIIVSTNFMMGFPEETKETLDETIKFCIGNNIHLVTVFLVTPYPGTALYEQVKKMGLIKDEEEYIGKLGDATELTINLTKWSDKELLEKRSYVLSKIRNGYFKKNRGGVFFVAG